MEDVDRAHELASRAIEAMKAGDYQAALVAASQGSVLAYTGEDEFDAHFLLRMPKQASETMLAQEKQARDERRQQSAEEISCSFCGRRKIEVHGLVGATAAICDQGVRLCVQTMRGERIRID